MQVVDIDDVFARAVAEVVGRAVRDLVDAGEAPSALTPARLSAAAVEAIGRPVELDAAILAAAIVITTITTPMTATTKPPQAQALPGSGRSSDVTATKYPNPMMKKVVST